MSKKPKMIGTRPRSKFFAYILKHYRPLLINYVGLHWPYVPSHSREDIVQETLVKLWRQRKSTAALEEDEIHPDTLAAILFSLIKEVLIDWQRRTKSKRRNSGVHPLSADDLEGGLQSLPATQAMYADIDTAMHPSEHLRAEDIREQMIAIFWALERNPRQSRRELIILLRMCLVMPNSLGLSDIVASLTSEERIRFFNDPSEAALSVCEQRKLIKPRVKSSLAHIREKLGHRLLSSLFRD